MSAQQSAQVRRDARGVITGFAGPSGSLEVAHSCFSYAGKLLDPQQIAESIQIDESNERLVLTGSKPSDSAQKARFSLSCTLDSSVSFHLAEAFNIVRKIDEQMPVGVEYSGRKGSNFCVIEGESVSVGFWSDEGTEWQRNSQLEVSILRVPSGFLFSVSAPVGQSIVISIHSDPEEAAGAYTRWISEELGFAPRSARAIGKEWVDSVRLSLTVDMLRSNGEVAHSYQDMTQLAEELAAAGAPPDTLVYLPGWNGRYDSAYPSYAPCEELGGEPAFERMIEAMHANALRVLLHTNPWGLDPYHPQIDELLKYAIINDDGSYAGFQTPSPTKWGITAPEAHVLAFSPGPLPLSAEGSGKRRRLLTPEIPADCEAQITIGGLKGIEGRVEFAHDGRTIRTPEGWFTNHDEYTFPFALRLLPGENALTLAGTEALFDREGAWYRIHNCRVPVNPYATWTYPILFGDTANEEWINLVVGNIAETVERYQIDAIHCDATEYQWNHRFYRALRDRLPQLAVSGEGYATLSALGYYEFAQSHHNLSLTDYRDTYTAPEFQAGVPDWSATEEQLAWLDVASPLCGFTDKFTRIYPHLCAADAFVPAGRVCNWSAQEQVPRNVERLRNLLEDAKRLGYIPGLRINYRAHGLDKHTRAYLASLRG